MIWQTIGSILGYVVTVGVCIVIFVFKNKITHKYNEALAIMQTKLDTDKEMRLSEYRKGITGFNKFFDKKYDVYPLIYAEIQKTQGVITSWWPTQFVNDFSKLTKEEMQGYLDSFNFSIPDKRLLLEKREKDCLNQVDFLRLLPNHIRLSIQQSNNCFQFNRLFLSKNVETLVNEIILHFNDAWSGYFGVFSSIKNDSDKGDKIKQSYEASGKKIISLKNQMHSELEHNWHE